MSRFPAVFRSDAGSRRHADHRMRRRSRLEPGRGAHVDDACGARRAGGRRRWHWDGPFRDTLRSSSPPLVRDVSVEVKSWDDARWAQGAAALMLATPFDLGGVAGRQTPHVLARLHGDGRNADDNVDPAGA